MCCNKSKYADIGMVQIKRVLIKKNHSSDYSRNEFINVEFNKFSSM